MRPFGSFKITVRFVAICNCWSKVDDCRITERKNNLQRTFLHSMSLNHSRIKNSLVLYCYEIVWNSMNRCKQIKDMTLIQLQACMSPGTPDAWAVLRSCSTSATVFTGLRCAFLIQSQRLQDRRNDWNDWGAICRVRPGTWLPSFPWRTWNTQRSGCDAWRSISNIKCLRDW